MVVYVEERRLCGGGSCGVEWWWMCSVMGWLCVWCWDRECSRVVVVWWPTTEREIGSCESFFLSPPCVSFFLIPFIGVGVRSVSSQRGKERI